MEKSCHPYVHYLMLKGSLKSERIPVFKELNNLLNHLLADN